MGSYTSPMRRYHSIQQAAQVLTLLGYALAYRNGKIVPGEWVSNRNKPKRVTVGVSGPYPHRVVVRAQTATP